MIIAVFAFSGAGNALKTRLSALLEREGHRIFPESPGASLSESVAEPFREADALIFIGACGIAVRGIARFVSSKTTDPAVLVIDETARWVISLLSGHIGGANDLARSVAALLGAQPVITTATDTHQVFAVDVWASRRGFAINCMEKAKAFSSRLLGGEEIPVKSDYPLPDILPKGLKAVSPADGGSFGMAISVFTGFAEEWLHIVPRTVYLGIGCRKGIDRDALDRVVTGVLADRRIDLRSIAGAGTIDLKKDEPGLTALCRDRGWLLRWYSAEELMSMTGDFAASAFTAKITGADNVCERAAVMASGGGRLLFGKSSGEGVTVAAAEQFFSLSFEDASAPNRSVNE